MLVVRCFLKAWIAPICAVGVAMAIGVGPWSQAYAVLVYWQNFEGGDGVADAGVGNLAIDNGAGTPPGATLFSSTGGISGGAYDATSNVAANFSTNNNGIASTAAIGGTALSALPNQTGSGAGSVNQFTISFWFKTQTYSNNANSFSRLLNLGPTGTADLGNADSLSFTQFSTDSNPGATKIYPFFGGTDVTNATGIGADNNLNEWTFIAFSYDGTSSSGDNSSVQNSATGSPINGQFYRGTDTEAVVRTDLPIVATVGTPSSASLGAINFGNNAVLFLANRPSLTRALDGWIDDIRLYDTVLSAADIEGVRLQGLGSAVPEPISLSLLVIVGIALFANRERRHR